jgi:hypothetical protein
VFLARNCSLGRVLYANKIYFVLIVLKKRKLPGDPVDLDGRWLGVPTLDRGYGLHCSKPGEVWIIFRRTLVVR